MPSALLTDLYELTMAAAYFENQFNAIASFELFVRSLPRGRGYLLAAGLEQGLEFLENLHFESRDIEYLRAHPMFRHVSPAFFEYLRGLRFSGEVWAIREGTPVFGEEPLLRLTAPIIEAQLVETCLLATLTFQTMIATKAARLNEAAQGRGVVDFGTRRAHGPEAGVLAARAAYIGGCLGTSNVEAGARFGIPTYGTVAHSFIMAHEREEDAFAHFERLYPETNILLVDTYDTLRAIEKIIRMGMHPHGVRLDSGNMAELSKQVRRRLDQAGLTETKIYASGDLDEFSIARLLSQEAPIDFFAVGTALVTSSDAPALGGVYKLVEVHENRPRQSDDASVHEGHAPPRYTAKFSDEKVTYPGTKQVFRFYKQDNCFEKDLIACSSEQHSDGEPLLSCVMRNGRRTAPSPSLDTIRRHVRQNLPRVPAPVRELREPANYPVVFSRPLRELLQQVRRTIESGS